MSRLTDAGAGILMISSELPEVLGMSDRIYVMRHGAIQAELDADTATEERVLQAALGLASLRDGSRARDDDLARSSAWPDCACCCGFSRRTFSRSRTR